MATGRDINVRLTVRDDGTVVMKRFGRQVDRTSRRGERSLNRMNRASRSAAVGMNTLTSSVSRLTGVVAALVAVGLPLRGAVQATNRLDVALAGLRAVSGATADDMARLEDQARKLGETTQFSASQTAEAQEFLARAGFQIQDILTATPATLDLAAAGNLDLARAADLASNVLQGFQKDASELNEVVDIMAATASNANTSVEQMGSAMSFVAPVAQSFGVSIRETAAGIATLSNAGLQGQRAGTGLRRVLTELANPSARLREVMGGMTLVGDGLVAVLRQIAGSSLSATEALEIFGDRGGPAFNVLRAGADSAREFVRQLRNVEGAAAEIARTRLDTLPGDVRQLSSAMEGLGIAIGRSGIIDKLRKQTQGLTSLVRAMTSLIKAANDTSTVFGQFAQNLSTLARQLDVFDNDVARMASGAREFLLNISFFGGEAREALARTRASAQAAAKQLLTTGDEAGKGMRAVAEGARNAESAVDRLEEATKRIQDRQRIALQDAQAFADSQEEILRARFEARAPDLDPGERREQERALNEEIERLRTERFDREIEIARNAAGQQTALISSLVQDEAQAAQLKAGIAEDLARQEIQINIAKLAAMRQGLISTLNEEQRLRSLAARAGEAAQGGRPDESENDRLIRLREEAQELTRIGASLDEQLQAWQKYNEEVGGSAQATQNLLEIQRQAKEQADALAEKAEEQAAAEEKQRAAMAQQVQETFEVPELAGVKLDIDDSEWQLFLQGLETPSEHTVKINTEQARREGGPILRQGGGRIPGGYGGGDKVDVKAEAGEFMLRKEVGRVTGLRFLTSLNANPDRIMELLEGLRIRPPLYRQSGGPIGDLPEPGFGSGARDQVDINLNINGERISGTADRDFAEGLARALKGLQSSVAGGV